MSGSTGWIRALPLLKFGRYAKLSETTQAAQYIGLVCNPSPCWPFFQPFRMQQMQKNGLALHSALTLRTYNHPTAAQVHHKPSGQHLRCIIACAYAAIWPAAFRLNALSQQTILGKSIFILPMAFRIKWMQTVPTPVVRPLRRALCNCRQPKLSLLLGKDYGVGPDLTQCAPW